LKNALSNALDAFKPQLPLAVAYSGGADSTALLGACHFKWPGQVHAVHINHGLQAAAIDFETHARAFCLERHIPLIVVSVNAEHASGQSPEDAARRARYQAIEEALLHNWGGQVRDVALAQHAQDQIETVILALSRGAGLPGLSGMRAHWVKGGVNFHRPILQVSGEDLREYNRMHGLLWVEDPTNVDIRYTRNRIRHNILPPLQESFPEVASMLCRSAKHMAQAQRLLDELAAMDLVSVGNPPHIKALQTFGIDRMGNVLRHWLASQACQASDAQMQELMRQIRDCQTRGHQIELKVGSSRVLRQGETLTLGTIDGLLKT